MLLQTPATSNWPVLLWPHHHVSHTRGCLGDGIIRFVSSHAAQDSLLGPKETFLEAGVQFWVQTLLLSHVLSSSAPVTQPNRNCSLAPSLYSQDIVYKRARYAICGRGTHPLGSGSISQLILHSLLVLRLVVTALGPVWSLMKDWEHKKCEIGSVYHYQIMHFQSGSHSYNMVFVSNVQGF